MSAALPTTTRTVGAFSIKDGALLGPAIYLTERGNARLAQICAGTDEVFNATAGYCPDIETAVLVWLQTDYAAWLGQRELMARLGGQS